MLAYIAKMLNRLRELFRRNATEASQPARAPVVRPRCAIEPLESRSMLG